MSQPDNDALVTDLMRYESGEIDNIVDEAAFFQRLINSGAVWSLQGHYQRRAKQFIASGLCELPAEAPPGTKPEKRFAIGLSPDDAWLEAALHIGRHVAYYVDNDLPFDDESASVIRHVCYRIVGGAGVDTHDPATRKRLNTLIDRAINQAAIESPAWKRPVWGEREH